MAEGRYERMRALKMIRQARDGITVIGYGGETGQVSTSEENYPRELEGFFPILRRLDKDSYRPLRPSQAQFSHLGANAPAGKTKNFFVGRLEHSSSYA